MEDLQRKKLLVLLKELEGIRGRHTELVTVYVPAGFNMAVVSSQLKQEQSTAQNIKSKTVRKNVTGALEKIVGHLKLYKKTPDNGLAIFCGNVSGDEGAAKIDIWAIEPPEAVKVRLYRCDQTFILDPLKDLVREKEVYGLIVVDKGEADVGILKGKRIILLKHLESMVPGKTRKGGQSSARFARVREGLLFDFLKKVGEVASHQLKELPDLKGVIVGGPGLIHDRFVNEDFLRYDIKNKVMGTLSTSYTGETGLNELVERGEDILQEASVMKEKRLLDRFFSEFARDTGLAIYGIREVMETLDAGNIEILIVSEAFEWIKAEFKNPQGEKVEKIIPHHELNKVEKDENLTLIEKEDLLDVLIRKSEQMGTLIEMVSIHTPKGEQLKELGGIAGILRFKA